MNTSQQADPLIGRLVDGRYRVRARIARGGMATVYVATDMRLERRVALKVMHGHLSDDTVFQSRFIQEARSAARLADPHVVNVFDQGQDGDMAYLVMEYLPGITLRELLREQKRLTIAQTVTIMDAILSGLAAAHRGGIVHRDVKPENVLLAEDGRIKIGDFGLARATTANTASGQMLLGTIAYLAPELVTRGSADARSDIYALGIMLYEMLVGEQPYKGEQPMQIAYQHATDSVPRPSAKNPGVPEQLDELVLWATEKVPDDRPIDAGVMLARLREIERDLGVAPQVARAVSIGTTQGDDGIDSGEMTKVFPPSMTGPTSTVAETDNAARLRAKTKRRAAKGAWLLALVIVLAALAGGIGWWFGSGPGSLVAVPQVSGQPLAEAQAALAERGLTAVPEDRFHFDIPAGTVIDSDPAPGSLVDKDTSVAVRVSAGPQPHDIEALAGMSADQARGILNANNLSVTEPFAAEFTDAPANTVIGVTVANRFDQSAQDCLNGCRVLEGDTASFVISLGPLPSPVGLDVDEATSRLDEVGVGLEQAGEEYSDSVAEGDIIYYLERSGGGNWRPGDTVRVIVSMGPRPVPVPDVRQMTVADALARLEDAGLRGRSDLVWPLTTVYVVTGTDPAPGTAVARGTTVTITGFTLGG